MDELTPRQQQILALIQRHVVETGSPPTRSEIARELGFRSPNAAEQHLRALARKGVIEMRAGASRGIRLLTQPNEGDATGDEAAEGLPVVGRVAAGSPVLAEEHIDWHYPVTPELFTPRADYLLRVRGMSMKDVGILEDDLLAVHRTTEVQNGQIVVARLHDEVTVKRFERRDHRVRLLPENPEFEPIELDLRVESLAIEGRGVGVIRPEL
jgi:repressor LexA